MKSLHTNTANLAQSFRTLVNENFIRYNGCLIEKSGGKFIALQKKCDTLEAAKQVIDEAFKTFKIK